MTSRRLRVAHVGTLTNGENADGVTKTIEGLVGHLSAHQVEPEVWQFATHTREPKVEWVRSVRVLKIPRSSKTGLPFAPKERCKAMTPFTTGIDLLHLHSVFRADNIWATRIGIPYVLTPNGGYSRGVIKGRRRWLKKIWITLWEKRLWSEARFLHAVSEREASELKQLPNAPRIVTISNGIRGDDIAETRIPNVQRTYWVSVGRLATHQKGLDVLLNGYAIADERCPLPPLRVVGPDFRGELAGLKARAQQLGIATKIHFDGAVFGVEKRRILEHASLLVQCSRWEGMPFTVLEAMAVGTPVLVTPGTNLADDVSNADAGWTCEARAESIAHVLSAIATSSNPEHDRKGTNGHRLIRERFMWEYLAAQMAAAYHTACE